MRLKTIPLLGALMLAGCGSVTLQIPIGDNKGLRQPAAAQTTVATRASLAQKKPAFKGYSAKERAKMDSLVKAAKGGDHAP